MKKCKIIGLTGQTGAGKSTVAHFLEESGAAIINADSLVHKLYGENTVCSRSVAAVFGNDILNPDSSVDRRLLAERAFASKESIALLNSVVHPFVMYELLMQIKTELKNGAELIIYDAPQLFESNSDLICDSIISVVADRQVRLKRICSRDNISEEAARERMNAQLDEEFFRANSDYIIENNADLKLLKEQLQMLKEILMQR